MKNNTNTEYTALDKETARQSHMGTSFSPDRRGEQEIQSHKGTFEELAAELGDFFEQKHADKLHELWTAYLHSHAAVMSTMITGPANFPVERNLKKSDWADNKRRAIWEYCDNLKKWKGKADRREAVEAAGGELAIARAKLEGSKAHHEAMKAANRIIRKALKAGGITEETKAAVIAAGIDKEEAEAVTNPNSRWVEIRGYGFPAYKLTNSNARIKTTAARVAELERREAAKESGAKPKTYAIDGGEIIVDTVENRINVKHDEKPSRDVITLIKSHGFHWSRNYGTWTRKLTPNAVYSAKLLLKALNTKVEA